MCIGGNLLGRVFRFVLEGLLVAGFAAGAFALPWLWVRFFPPPGPYTRSASHRIGPQLPAPEPLTATGRPSTLVRSTTPTPAAQRFLFLNLRRSPVTLTAYEGSRPVLVVRAARFQRTPEYVQFCPRPNRDPRHWYKHDRLWLEWSLDPSPPSAADIAASAPGRGRPACIWMHRDEAERLWEWAPEGAGLYIYSVRGQRSRLPATLEAAARRHDD